MISRALPTGLTATRYFAVAAVLLALVSGGGTDRSILRFVVELPLLVLLGFVIAIIISAIAASGAALFGGSSTVAAVIAVLLGWLVSAGPNAFAGLGYHDLLQPAFALALGAAWLRSSTTLHRSR